MKNLICGLCAGALLAVAGVPASAQDAGESACAVPGLTLLTDPSGDATIVVVPEPVGLLDLVSLQLAQPTQDDGVLRLVFTLKTSALTTLPPQSAWYSSFEAPGGTIRGVRMQTDSQGTASFISYVAAASSATDGGINGSLVDSSKPAEAGSTYTADGTITIIVNATDIGLRDAGAVLKGFNAGSILTAGDPNVGSAAFPTDNMPDDESRSGSYTLAANGSCAATARAAAPGQFGGALNLALLLPLALLGLRRRRG